MYIKETETLKFLKNDKNIFTFSMHCKTNYPAKSNSDLDVELEENLEDKDYLEILKNNLLKLNKMNFDFAF